jgi:cephalosporin hydroxylase
MDPHAEFRAEVEANVDGLVADTDLQRSSLDWVANSAPHKYAYNFTWMGRPIIQFPQDMIAVQEIIWAQRPDVVLETGIAHGGSIIYYASLLELVGHGEVIGIDIDIREHNRKAIEGHPMAKRISMVEGSSIDADLAAEIRERVAGKNVLVVLDSNHTHEHVLAELRLYAPLVPVGGYCVVMDTVVEDMPGDAYPDRPWGRGNNPKTAVRSYLDENPAFEIDERIHSKILITVAPDGYLRRVAD